MARHRAILAGIVASGLAFGSVAALAQSAEDVVTARLGYQHLLGLGMGGVSAMAKGDVPYDAALAETHASNLALLADIQTGPMMAPGTSNADLPGKTRALPAIWENPERYAELEAGFREAVAGLVAVAGDGADALGPAVTAVGGSCRACHTEFRAEDY
jgi:cytochrome c556